jgi:signal peptidase I
MKGAGPGKSAFPRSGVARNVSDGALVVTPTASMPTQRSVARMVLQPLAIAIVLAAIVRAGVGIYSIPSDSMAPTLAAGDRIVVTPYFGRFPQRGDIVVFRSPVDPDEMLVKRVVAVPGDLIDSSLGRVRVGGYTLAEHYIFRQTVSGSIPAQIVPPDSYFLLGDNREDSVDSRNWGTVGRSTIVGRAHLAVGSLRPPVRSVHAATQNPVSPAYARRGSRLFTWLD